MTYQSEVLADSPIVYLELNDTSGTAAVDQGSHAVNGTYQNGVTLNQTGLTGMAAAQFDGSDDFVDVPDHADLDITGDLTLEMLVYPTSFANYRMLITKVNGDTGPYQWLLRTGDGIPEFRFGAQVIPGTAAPSLNSWNHMAVTRIGTAVTHYLNGATNGTGTTSGSVAANAEPLRIGKRSENNYYFIGKLMEAAVYGSGLSGARISAHYAAAPWPPSTARISQVAAEVLALSDPTLRSSMVAAEVMALPNPILRSSMVGVEVAALPNPSALVSIVGIEVITPEPLTTVGPPVRLIWF